MASGSLSGAVSPGMIRVDERIGSPNSSSSACTTGWSGTRRPMVLRLGWSNRRGTSRVPGSRKVYAPGMPWRTMRTRVIAKLGEGSMGAVYVAEHALLGKRAAVKVLHPQLASAARADARRRFFAEGRVAAGLRHPGVVAIYDVDETTRVLAMEYVAGGTLRARLASRAGASLAPGELVATATSLLEALAYVHARGVAHGDLKPSNLLLREPGAVVLADFGAAELRDDLAAATDGPAGTPQYLAPERLLGGRPSAATDLYAAGAILWEAAAGRPLRTHADLLRGATTQAPLAPAARDALGPRLAAVVTALLDAAPTSRPASARDALAAI